MQKAYRALSDPICLFVCNKKEIVTGSNREERRESVYFKKTNVYKLETKKREKFGKILYIIEGGNESMKKNYTDKLMEDIRHCTDIEKSVEKNQKYFNEQAFSQFLDTLLKKYGKKMQDLINETDYSKPMLYHIKNNERVGSQRAIIQIGLAIGVTVDEMQQLLKLSHNQELYPRYQRDYIILCGISAGMGLYEIDEELKKRGIMDLIEKSESV